MAMDDDTHHQSADEDDDTRQRIINNVAESDSKPAKDNKDEDDDHRRQESHFPLPPDLAQVSVDIDEFIPSLSSDHIASLPDLPVSVYQFAYLVEATIDGYDSGESPRKWVQLTPEEMTIFLEALNRASTLSKALLKFHSHQQQYAPAANRIGRLLQRAMSYVEEEFKSLLENHNYQSSNHNTTTTTTTDDDDKPNQSESLDQNPSPELPNMLLQGDHQDRRSSTVSGYAEDTLSNMITLSKVLISGGYETECCHAYSVARRNALEEIVHKLGFEKHSIDDVQKMQWESLEKEIQMWVIALKQWGTVHMPTERKLVDTVFADYPAISEGLFGRLSYGVTLQLLNFAEAVALTKRAVERLFKFLDVYEAVRDSLPEIGELMPEKWRADLKYEASLINTGLGDAMISIFNDLENSIKADTGKTQVPGGAVHPLTKYTMNYLEYACEYKGTLDQVFNKSHNKLEVKEKEEDEKEKETKSSSAFQGQIMKVMELLEENVEGKAKLYKDPSLSSIFMMNNGRYILKKMKASSELNSLMGETWYRKKSSDLRQYHMVYQRETWGKLLSCYQAEGLVVKGKVSKPVLKERFKSFNAMFDEIHRTQTGWVMADEQLQSELRVSISNMVIPAYRSFLGRYSPTFTPGRQTEKYVKYQPEDIEACIDELFDGKK